MQSLHRTRPRTLDDLTIQVAIVRPGPIQGGAVNPYIERLQRLREDPDYEVPYDHPSLEPVLRDTLGTIIFQDQVIEVAMAFAGFSPGEAEGLRRAMSRKRSEAAMEAYHRRFVAGAVARHGVDEARAERVWDMVKGFSGFGFPKAHGAAFGLLAYQSTWLRVHYGPEFLCCAAQRAADGLLPARRARARGPAARASSVLAADVNASAVECTVEAGGTATARCAHRAGLRAAASAPRRSGRSWPRASAAGRSRARRPGRARRGRARRRSSGWPGRARATGWAATGAAAPRCGSSASPPAPGGGCAGARSSRCRSTSPPRPGCRAGRVGADARRLRAPPG